MRRRLNTLVALVACAALLAGCGDDETQPSGDPQEPTSSAGSESPTEEPGDTVEPATGKAVEGEQFSVNIPEGWKTEPEMVGLVFTYDPSNTDVIGVAAVSSTERTLDQAAKVALDGGRDKVRRLGDTTLGGRDAYHVTAAPVGDQVYEEFGLWTGGQLVSIEFEIEGSDAQRQAVIDSVLATWQWK